MLPTLSPSELAWLRCFNAAAQSASFTKAAQELHVSQGAVSQQVKKLEERLNCQLMLRTPTGLVLTPQGEQLYNATQLSFHSLRDAMRLVRTPSTPKAVQVSCSPSLAMLWLTLRLNSFYREHSNYALTLLSETGAVDRPRMARDRVALAIRPDADPCDGPHEAILMDEWIVPVASPEFLAAHPEIRQPSDLKSSHLVHGADLINGMLPTVGWSRWLHGLGLDQPVSGGRPGAQFNLSLLAIQAALGGQGIAMSRVAYILHYLKQGRLMVPFPHRFRLDTNYHAYGSAEHPDMSMVLSWLSNESVLFRAERDAYFAETGIAPIN